MTRLDLEAHLADFSAVVEAAGLDRFAIFGMSQGAAVAVRYAVQHPERVTCLVLCGGHAGGWRRRDPADVARHELLQETIRVGRGTDDPVFRHVFTTLFVPGGRTSRWAGSTSWPAPSQALATTW